VKAALTINGKGENFMQLKVIYNDYSATGGTPGEIGSQLWDSLAGVSQSEIYRT